MTRAPYLSQTQKGMFIHLAEAQLSRATVWLLSGPTSLHNPLRHLRDGPRERKERFLNGSNDNENDSRNLVAETSDTMDYQMW